MTTTPDAPLGSSSALASELMQYTTFVVNKMAERAMYIFDSVLDEYGISVRHCSILVLLDERGPMRQVDLSDATGYDRNAITGLVDDLEALDLVRRERDPDDRRAYAVTPTDAGLSLLETVKPMLHETEKQMLEPLSEEERTHLDALLTRILEQSDYIIHPE